MDRRGADAKGDGYVKHHIFLHPALLTMQHSVVRFAEEVVAPKVRDMDENEMMDPEVIRGLFDTGVSKTRFNNCARSLIVEFKLMGIETSEELGGSGFSFTSAIIAIEELAKIDPSVSVMCDVHNTLVNTVIRKYGTQAHREKYLPMLATSDVSLTDVLTQEQKG